MADILRPRSAADHSRYAVAQIWLANWARIGPMERDLCRMGIREFGTAEEKARLAELERDEGGK
jgi:hypothetical protein